MLTMTEEQQSYTLSDRATYLARQKEGLLHKNAPTPRLIKISSVIIFGKYISLGVTAVIVIQAFMNISVTEPRL